MDELNLSLTLPSHDIYLTASLEEAGANHVLEALACGLPVLTTTLMGANEIVTPNVGMKCMPSSISGISKMLYKFHQLSPHKRYLLGQNAKQHVNQHYNPFNQAKQLSKWVEAL